MFVAKLCETWLLTAIKTSKVDNSSLFPDLGVLLWSIAAYHIRHSAMTILGLTFNQAQELQDIISQVHEVCHFERFKLKSTNEQKAEFRKLSISMNGEAYLIWSQILKSGSVLKGILA